MKKNLKAMLMEDMKRVSKEKDKNGYQAERYIDRDSMEGISFYRPKKGRNIIDIIPFTFATDLFKDKGKKKGDVGTILEVYTHRYFNQRGSQCICLKDTFGKKCAICEMRDKYREMDEEKYKEEINNFKSKHRTLANIVNLKEDEDDEFNGQIQIFDESHWLWAKKMLKEVDANEEEYGDPVDWATPDEGQSIKFRADDNPNFKCFDYEQFFFLDRDEGYDDGIMEYDYSDEEFEHGAFPLDAILKIHTYEEQLAMLSEETVAEEEDEPEFEEEEEEKSSRRKRGKKTKAKAQPKDEPEEEEVSEEETSDDGEKTDTSRCPFGKTFGVDGDMTDETCIKCKKANKALFVECIVESN